MFGLYSAIELSLMHPVPCAVQNSPEQAENAIKAIENFIATMEANDEKVLQVVRFGQRCIDEGNYASDRIRVKLDLLLERCACGTFVSRSHSLGRHEAWRLCTLEAWLLVLCVIVLRVTAVLVFSRRRDANHKRAQAKLEKLKDQLIAQTLLAQCKDVRAPTCFSLSLSLFLLFHPLYSTADQLCFH